MEKTAILAITKNGIKIAKELKEKFSSWEVFAPDKFSDGSSDTNWYANSTTEKIADLFKSNDALVCLFSLGAVVRLISPHLKDKKTDPAVIVIDDQSQFVISALSGHLGGANQLTNDIAKKLGATPVITTAADVNKTIAVDLVGKDFGWKIDDDSNVTRISAFMVNKEKIAVYQSCGARNWWQQNLPENVSSYSTLDELKKSKSRLPESAYATTIGGDARKLICVCGCILPSKLRLPDKTLQPIIFSFVIASDISFFNGPELPMHVVQP